MTKGSYADTYWCHRGKHQKLNTEVEKLVPESGEVSNADENRALEAYRQAANCYYDLYNNGLCNLGQEFAEVFGFVLGEGEIEEFSRQTIVRVERKMDAFILAAAKEQRKALRRVKEGK